MIVSLWAAFALAAIPEEVVREALTPRTAMGETLEPWEPVLTPIAQALAKGAETPLQAAMQINAGLWDRINVHYSTARDFPNQPPLYSMRIHKASCSGLSILLVDACRSVGIPARIISCNWRKKPGNHTWVEVWSEGEWVALGASESGSGAELWFAQDAAAATSEDPRYAIYALQVSETGLRDSIWGQPAVDVTARYRRDTAAEATFHVSIWRGGKRVRMPFEYGGETYTSPGPEQDLNDCVALPMPLRAEANLTIGGKTISKEVTPNEMWRVELEDE